MNQGSMPLDVERHDVSSVSVAVYHTQWQATLVDVSCVTLFPHILEVLLFPMFHAADFRGLAVYAYQGHVVPLCGLTCLSHHDPLSCSAAPVQPHQCAPASSQTCQGFVQNVASLCMAGVVSLVLDSASTWLLTSCCVLLRCSPHLAAPQPAQGDAAPD